MQTVKPRARYFRMFNLWCVAANGKAATSHCLDGAIEAFYKEWLDRQLRRPEPVLK